MNLHLCKQAVLGIIGAALIYGLFVFLIVFWIDSLNDDSEPSTTTTTELGFAEQSVSRFQLKVSRGSEQRGAITGVTSTSSTASRLHQVPTTITPSTTQLHASYGYGSQTFVLNPLLRRIGGCESTGRADGPLIWTAKNKKSSASGAFQYLDSTWNKYRGYIAARFAPPEIQIERAVSDFDLWQRRGGNGPWYSSRACWG